MLNQRMLVHVVAVGALVVIAGCGSSKDDARYSISELRAGVDVTVNDRAEAIAFATVFLPDDLPSYRSFHPALAERRIAVQQPGEGGYDLVILYRTGPYCGLLPSVAVTGNRAELDVAIRTRGGGDCDSQEYDEAIGLDLRSGFEGVVVSAHQGG